MTTYSRVNAALYAYNTAAAQCGRSEISWRRVAERCGAKPQVFFDHCNAIAQSQRPVLSPDAEALAAAVLRDLEEQTAALLSARGNGADPNEEPGAKQELRADAEVEAKALQENVETDAEPDPDSDEELGEIADETFGEEDRSPADLIAEAEALERSNADGARRILDEAARLGFDDLGTAMLRDAIRASTKLDRSAVNSGWRGAKAKVEREAKQAEKEAKQREAEEAKQREAEEVQATAERAQAEAEALREQRAERVAPLARDPNLLGRVVAAVHRLGVVREDVAIEATYLTVTSRLLRRRVISLLRRGTAAAGKNYLIEQVILLLPAESVITISGSSPKVLAYFGGDDPDFLAFKVVYIPEAASLLAQDGKEHEMARMLRTLISENKLNYPVVVVREGGLPPITVMLVKNGPIAVLITSARDDIEKEMLTRLAFADADESASQSSRVVSHALKIATGEHDRTAEEEGEIELLRDFQHWLENNGPYDVIVPFAPQIRAAFGRTPRAVRIRRDIGTLIAGVAASAVLHKAQREVDAKGRVVAILADYEHAWNAFNPGVSIFHNPQSGPGVIALVRALEDMIEVKRKAFEAASAVHRDYRERHDPDAYRDPRESFEPVVEATWSQLTRALGLASQDTISTRLTAAKAAGVIVCVNENAHRNVPRRYKVLIGSSELARSGAAPVFPPTAQVVRMTNDPAAYESAREAIIKEEEREGGPEAAARVEEEFDVPF